MKIVKHLLVAISVLALGPVLSAAGSAQTAPQAVGTGSCNAIVQGIGCFGRLLALCSAVEKSAVPPLSQGDKIEMISAVVRASTQISQGNLELAIQDMDGLQQTFDQLSYAAQTKILDADAENIGSALSAASLCIDGLN